MYLQRKIAAAHGVEKIEADGKLGAKTGMDCITKELPWMRENKVESRNFKMFRAKTDQQAVFFWNTVEAPGVIGFTGRQVADFFHPMAAPRARIKEGNNAEGTVGGGGKRGAEGWSGN